TGVSHAGRGGEIKGFGKWAISSAACLAIITAHMLPVLEAGATLAGGPAGGQDQRAAWHRMLWGLISFR
ncbi:hypothetical protein BaRGS_00006676, partial [Batillaria attramentaria]